MTTPRDQIQLALQSSDESEICYALEDEVVLNDLTLLPQIIVLLNNPRTRIRESAIATLIQIGGTQVAASVAPLMYSEDAPIRNGAIEILEHLGESAIETLIEYSHSSSVDVRKFSIDSLGKLITTSPELQDLVFKELVDHLKDLDCNVAGSAANALGILGNEISVVPLIEAIFDSKTSAWLQCNIIAALSRIKTSESRTQLEKLIHSSLSNEAKICLELTLKGEVI